MKMTVKKCVEKKPFKYAEIPQIYGKPLVIICVAFQECEMIHGTTPILGARVRESHKTFIDYYKSFDIHFTGCSDLLKKIKLSKR